MYNCQQHLISPNPELRSILEFITQQSNKLSNCAIYYSRQLYFKTGRIPSKFDLISIISKDDQNVHFKTLYSDTSQQILIGVAESFKSYIGLVKAYNKGTITNKPRLPNYRTKEGLAVVTYTGRSVKVKCDYLQFPLGNKIKSWFGISNFQIPMPTNIDISTIKEYRIVPRNGAFYVEYVYKTENITSNVSLDRVLMIDHGLSNWLTCVSNIGTSFIIDGKHLKSTNQWYNKYVAKLQSKLGKSIWSNKLSRVTEKRNRRMRDAINKSARLVLNYCFSNQIGTLVFGWNKGQKQNINIGSKNNQQFVQIPTGRLKTRIEDMCKQYGIVYVETEESYTSKASYIDNDVLPTFGEKPEGWKASGRRVLRGLYRCANGETVNADCNGAANIGRKVCAKLDLDLSGVSRGGLTAPKKILLWNRQKSPLLTTEKC